MHTDGREKLIGDFLDYTSLTTQLFIRSLMIQVSGFGILEVWILKQRHMNGLRVLRTPYMERRTETYNWNFVSYKHGK